MKILIFIFGIFSVLRITAQEVSERFEVLENGDEFTLKVSRTIDDQRDFVVEGSPYLDKEFKPGRWKLANRSSQEASMRYNGYYDAIQLNQNGDTFYLRKSPDVTAEIGGIRYEFVAYLNHGNLKSGYMTPLNQGNTVLYLRSTKILIPPRRPQHGYDLPKPPKFESRMEYYLKQKNRPAKALLNLSRKEVFAVLWDKYSELRKYAKQNKLDMRSQEEVIQVLKYYDTLKSVEQEDPSFEDKP
ncbi:hypothetical protein [Maribacter halichondriae]|uniref:hypothetical protein n=1 Tax=Maribacter halichondriae TaxID=2980554 RepID=UPI002359B13E|nr:hypothetical protein [Maribacter sp. Hal144]